MSATSGTPAPAPAPEKPAGVGLRLALVLIVVAAGVWLLGREGGWFAAIRIEPRFLVPLALLEAALLLLRGLLSRNLCARFGVGLGVGEAMSLAAWTGLANYVTPFVGGSGLRAVYLQRRHRLPFASFLSVQAATYTLHFTVASLSGIAALAVLDTIASPLRLSLLALFAAVLLGCGLAHRWPFPSPRGTGRLATGLRRSLEGWARLRERSLAPLWWLLILNSALQAIAVRLAFAAVGASIGWPSAILIAAVYSISILLAVTPAALGVSEGAIMLAAAGVGVGAPAGLAAAALRRGLALAVTALAAAFGSLRALAGRG